MNSRPPVPQTETLGDGWFVGGGSLGKFAYQALTTRANPQIKKSIKAFFTKAFNGEPGWDRTNDHLIKSQMYVNEALKFQ